MCTDLALFFAVCPLEMKCDNQLLFFSYYEEHLSITEDTFFYHDEFFDRYQRIMFARNRPSIKNTKNDHNKAN